MPPGPHRLSWQQNRKLTITNLLLIRAPKCLIREMKTPKTKPRSEPKARAAAGNSEQNVPYRKPALRSEAFARALIDAKACLNDSEMLMALFNEAAKKAAAVPKEPFKEYWPYLQTMLRLVRAYHRGDYNKVPDNSLLWIVAALNYLIDPFDLIPDATPVLGFVDDATVIEFVTDKTRLSLDEFMVWETGAL
jgi:uncharacterized membrane protein YkvA (DUF1232 family)